MIKTEKNKSNLEKGALSQISEALKDLYLTLPQLDESLTPIEKIELSVDEVLKTKEAIEQLIRYVTYISSGEGKTPIDNVSLGKKGLSQDIVEVLNVLHGIHTCEELSQKGMFDLANGVPGGLSDSSIKKISKFLVAMGYDSLESKLDDYDRASFENASVKPEDLLPTTIDNLGSTARLPLRRLIYAGINTYGRLTNCSKEELMSIKGIAKYSIQGIENHLSSLGLQLKQKDKD